MPEGTRAGIIRLRTESPSRKRDPVESIRKVRLSNTNMRMVGESVPSNTALDLGDIDVASFAT